MFMNMVNFHNLSHGGHYISVYESHWYLRLLIDWNWKIVSDDKKNIEKKAAHTSFFYVLQI